MQKLSLTNPYEDLKSTEKVSKISCLISNEDYYLLCQIKKKGIFDATFATLIHKLCASMRQHGITDYTSYDRFIELVLSTSFNLQPTSGETVIVPNRQTTIPNDRGGVTHPSPTLADVPVVGDSPQVRTIKRSGRPHGTRTKKAKNVTNATTGGQEDVG